MQPDCRMPVVISKRAVIKSGPEQFPYINYGSIRAALPVDGMPRVTETPTTQTTRNKNRNMMQAEWLPTVMQGSFSEVYVVDCDTLRFVQSNQTARRNLHYTANELAALTLPQVARAPSGTALESVLAPLRIGETKRAVIEVEHTRKDGTTYPVECRLYYCASDSLPVYIAIGNDLSARQASAEALQRSEARFRAIVSNTPGLFYQFLRKSDGSMSFP